MADGVPGISTKLTDVPLKVGHLKRYRDLVRLVVKYADAPSVRMAGLGPSSGARGAEEVDGERPRALARDLERMGPTYVKLGQVLSTRPDLLPRPYLDALARLQEEVEPFPWDDVEEVLEEELGVRPSKAFEAFERRPVAAASLGQVHRATLRGGRAVAVKVQRPGAAVAVRRDVEVLQELAHLADEYTEAGRKYAFSTLMTELERSLMAELDYRQEAENLEAMAVCLEEFDRLLVPRPVPDYVTPRVLAMDLVQGRSLGALSPLALQEVDGEGLLEELFEAYLKQTLVDGFLHADPHPGNVFLTDDGRLALLDLGMVLHISEAMRKHLVGMLLALGEGDESAVVDHAEAMGRSRLGYDRHGFERDVAELLGRARDARLERVDIGRIVMGIARLAGERGLEPPSELSLVGKTLLNLDGVAARLDPDFDATEAVRRNALALTERRFLHAVRPGKALGALLDAKSFAEELPRRIGRALDAVGNNDLEVRVRVIDESRILTGLQQMANRITTGLILAALIVGAALIMNIETTFTLLGYPVVAILFFLAAAFGGVVLIYNIWRGDRKTRKETEDR